MNPHKFIRDEILKALDGLVAEGKLTGGLDTTRVNVEPPREAQHGDLATNAAMVLAKPAGLKPVDLAKALVAKLAAHPQVSEASVAGPGFINLRLKDEFWQARLADILASGTDYGTSSMGAGASVNVEYVSANPTGPLHIAHARGAVIGDALASLLAKAGHRVTREYYINDAGAQVDVLARSTYLRYREALGDDIGTIPEGLYPGDYLKDAGAALADRDGRKWFDKPESEWLAPIRAFAIDAMMALIRDDLKSLGIEQEVFSSERRLVEVGAVQKAFDTLKSRDLIYVGVLEPPKGKAPDDWEPRPQTLFRATQFGDDVDRPLQKSDGSWTYFANDIAYHYDKFMRGFPTMIDIWGADHGGYIKRMQAAVTAITGGKGALDVKICQLVKLMRGGQPVKMSKRAGTFVTLREVVDEVGRDVVRFIMLTRKNDMPLDFDLEKVLEQSRDNPVFYVQYAHARASSVLRHAAEEMGDIDLSPPALAQAPATRLTDSAELGLIKLMASWPRLVESAAEAHEPHRVAFYLYDLAAAFHGLWNKGKDEASLRFLIAGDRDVTVARLAMVKALTVVIASGLGIFGVKPVEEMR
ncbi:arginine--tRNA ligase [Hypericibacter terrae]|uniref:Arginine--tRNA ligase n=1 Tax=Hypericibacter terrae TaxID=2602015 RepID=A0A5J6MR98_9PROT|nr:arginine--tRNA ligase [Hypericibacter terrae]QEX17396.1 arginine--tRNA ligase [Hypericibacter terrae]